jgi:hypothetical protein
MTVAPGGAPNRPRRKPARRMRAALVLALPGLALAGCGRDSALGPPDSFLLYVPSASRGAEGATSASGLPVLEPLAVDDERAAPLQKQFAVGFPAEMLRTDYLAKQLIRDAAVAGRRYPEGARRAAAEPTVIISGDAGAELGAGLAVKGFWGRPVDHPGVPWLALERAPAHDAALPQTLAGLLARRVVHAVAGGAGAGPGAPPAAVLLEGYARAMEVIAREWRVGEGPQGAVAPDAGTAAQRALFAGVRENQFTVGEDGAPRAAAALLADPGVAATVIYRLAQSKAVGRRVAPPEVYAPFVTDRVPPGVSPAAVLGPFRNFQAKLLSAWGRAVLAGTPPRDVAELVDVYARAMPAERSEAIRIFVVTTYGATVKVGGVRASGSDAGAALPELMALAAEVAAGRRSSRQAVAGP